MKKLLLLGLGLVLFAMPSHTQSVDASLSYSYFRLGNSGGLNQNGVSGSVAYNPNRWLGIVGDIGVYHASPSGVSINTTTYLFGPRLTLRNPTKINPFVQALFGGSRLSAGYGGSSAATNQFAFSVWRRRSGHTSAPGFAPPGRLRRHAQLRPDAQLHARLDRFRGAFLTAFTHFRAAAACLRPAGLTAVFSSCSPEAAQLLQCPHDGTLPPKRPILTDSSRRSDTSSLAATSKLLWKLDFQARTGSSSSRQELLAPVPGMYI
jgi:hypothetical protein